MSRSLCQVPGSFASPAYGPGPVLFQDSLCLLPVSWVLGGCGVAGSAYPGLPGSRVLSTLRFEGLVWLHGF